MSKIKSFLKAAKKDAKKVAECCPAAAAVMFVIAAVSLILKILFSVSESFADFYNRYPGAFVRGLFAKLTGWIPFSLAETLLMLLPIIITVLIVIIVRASKKTLRDMVKVTLSLFAALAFFFSSFTLGFAAGYNGSTLDKKLGIERKKVSVDELISTAEILKSELHDIKGNIDFKYGGSSVMPYSLSEMNEKLQDAYIKAAEKYDFIPSIRTKIKPVVLSVPMTYTHISGVYTYFTGESNINTNFPDYTLPYTAAHELAHQRGIAREDEANFVAFLVSLESDDSYIRYSAYMNLYEYVLSALYSADKEVYFGHLEELDISIRYEMIAYNEFFEKYRDNIIADISGSVNDKYLTSQGQTAGSKSYGMVVDLAVAYYGDDGE